LKHKGYQLGAGALKPPGHQPVAGTTWPAPAASPTSGALKPPGHGLVALGGCHHPPGMPGSFDETARRLSHEELGAAQLLVSEGHDVRSLAERHGPGAKGRTPDLLACGMGVEVKTFLPPAERGGRLPEAATVANKLLDARGQGCVALIWAKGKGLGRTTAEEGYRLFCAAAATEGLGKLKAVRIVGDGFDVVAFPAADVRVFRQARARTPRSPRLRA
jgi:hypothetical protein